MRTVVLSSNVVHPLSLELFRLLEADLGPAGLTLASFDTVDSYLGALQQAFVVAVPPDPDQALHVVDRLRAGGGGAILAVGPTGDPGYVQRFHDAGVVRYLDETQLAQQIKAVLPHLKGNGVAAFPNAGGRVLSIVGGSGGSGASTLAVNLAVILARQCRRCALIDLKPCGDLAGLMDLKPVHTLVDLCRNLARVDQAIFDKVLAEHAGGVRLLGAPQHYEAVREITPEGIDRALSLARKSFPYVVVDHEGCFHDEQVLALRRADAVFLVVRPDYTSLRHTRRILDQLGRLNIHRQRVRLVINRHGQPGALPTEEVRQALEIDSTHLIPDDPAAVNAAANTGEPLVLKTPSSLAAQAIERLGKDLCPDDPIPAANAVPSRGFLRWLMPFRS